MKDFLLLKRIADKQFMKWFLRRNVELWNDMPFIKRLPDVKPGRNSKHYTRDLMVQDEYRRRKTAEPNRTKESIINELADDALMNGTRLSRRTIRRILESVQI